MRSDDSALRMRWQRAYPVKHGVKVYGTTGENSWYVPVSARDKDWNLSLGNTWQVRRSNFDTMLLKEAEKRGATGHARHGDKAATGR